MGKNILQQRCTSSVLNNRHASEFFALERGARQGIEILADAIRNMNAINGIKLGEKEIKASLYADDATVFVRDWIPSQNFWYL